MEAVMEVTSTWLENLKELKKKAGITTKAIAEQTNLPEKTIIRIFQGDTHDPRVDTIRRVVSVLGGSLDDLFAESGAVIGDRKLLALQEERDAIKAELATATAELAIAKNSNAALKAENDLLQLKLMHKEEIIAHKEKIIALYSQVDKMREEHH
jgi:transcriptional regulator with XRE-family HTH domain